MNQRQLDDLERALSRRIQSNATRTEADRRAYAERQHQLARLGIIDRPGLDVDGGPLAEVDEPFVEHHEPYVPSFMRNRNRIQG